MSEEYTEKKPVVDKEKCIGCCLCPTVNFEYPDFKMVQTEQGEKAEVIKKKKYKKGQIEDAIEYCPVDAISQED
ncbi:MAG: ferredoxin [archaeon]|jgi:ferredoxin|nr:ferredoxin [Euryarchaeota archaeon]MDP6703982.1 ferredoxin [archaeon]|tara:strand:+ start:78463 stop:78684 length:222 start_codon:yes stop_codon:yes gene_type:complete